MKVVAPKWRFSSDVRHGRERLPSLRFRTILSAIARLDDGELQIVHSDLLLVKLGATCWHPIKALRGLAQASDLVLVSQLEQPSSADAAAALLTVLRSAIFSPMQVDEAGDEETAHMALAAFTAAPTVACCGRCGSSARARFSRRWGHSAMMRASARCSVWPRPRPTTPRIAGCAISGVPFSSGGARRSSKFVAWPRIRSQASRTSKRISVRRSHRSMRGERSRCARACARHLRAW